MSLAAFSTHKTPPKGVEFALLLLLSTLWGASYSFIKVGVETIPPLTFIAGRTILAVIVLIGVMWWKGLVLPKNIAVWRRFMVQALLNSVLPFTLIAWAEKTVDAGLATILNSTAPVMIFLITAAITKREPVSGRKAFGVAAGLCGTILIVGTGTLGSVAESGWRELAIIAATLCYALGAIYGRSFRSLDPILPAAGSLLCGTALLLPCALMIDRPWTLMPSKASIMALIALAVASTALAFVIYFRLVARLGAVATSAQAFIRVPIGVGIGMIMLGERPGAVAWGGLALVVVGVAAMTSGSKLPITRRRAVASPARLHGCSE